MFSHCSEFLLGAGPLLSGLDGHPVACSRGVQAGGELGWRAEVQRGLDNGRRWIGGHRKRQRDRWSQGHRFGRCRFWDGWERTRGWLGYGLKRKENHNITLQAQGEHKDTWKDGHKVYPFCISRTFTDCIYSCTLISHSSHRHHHSAVNTHKCRLISVWKYSQQMHYLLFCNVCYKLQCPAV